MTHTAAPTSLGLPFRWWDGVVAVVLWFASGFAHLFIQGSRFWYQLIAAGLVVGYLTIRRRLSRRTIFGEPLARRDAWLAVGLGLALTLFTAGVVAALRLASGYEHPVYPDWVVFQPYIEIPITALLSSVLLAPVIEEVVFRSILYRGILRSGPVWLAAGVSALVFGLFHFLEDLGLIRAVGAGVLSLVVIGLYNRTRSLWSAIAVHATANTALIVYGYIAARIVGFGQTLT